MAQHDYIIDNQSGLAFRQDLNNALAAIVSQNSGASAPSTTYAYQWWADTTTGLLKLRNAANNGWITLFQLDGEWTTIALENGTAAAPSIYFKDSGTDTGIYSPGTDRVAISTGGTGRLFIDSSGRLGLGTSSPNCLFEAKGGSAITTLTNSYSNCGILQQYSSSSLLAIGNDGTNPVLQGVNATNNTARNILLNPLGGSVGIGTTNPTANRGLTIKSANSNAGLAIVNTADDVVGLFAPENTTTSQELGIYSLSNMRLYTGGTQRATIDSSGRLLVGTSTSRSNLFGTTYSALFQVESQTTANAQVSLTSCTAGINGANLVLGHQKSGSVGGNTVVANNDQLGIVSFQGADGTNMVPSASIESWVDGTPGANNMPGRLVFSTTASGSASPTERLRINSDGQIFQYTNQYNFNSSNSTIEFVNRNSGGAKTFQWYIGASGGAPIATLTTAGVWTNASDVKNKENIEDITYGIEIIKSLRPRQFDVKSDGSHNIGFIAQEVKPLVPEVVHETTIGDTGESHLGLDYGSLTAVLTKALQEALAKIETLEVKVAALEGA